MSVKHISKKNVAKLLRIRGNLRRLRIERYRGRHELLEKSSGGVIDLEQYLKPCIVFA